MGLAGKGIVLAIGLAAVVFLVARALFLGDDEDRRVTDADGKPLRKPPNTLPFLGQGVLFLRARQRLFDWFARVERLHGYETLALTVPTLPPAVVIADPRNLDYVFRGEGALFTKGAFVKSRAFDLFGNGIINADGDMWRVQRKAGLQFLGNANLRVLTDVALPRILKGIVADLRRAAGHGGIDHTAKEVVDLQVVFHDITTQLMGKMAYNMEDMRADDAFATAFDFASGKTAERFQNPLWPVTEIFLGRHFFRSVGIVKAFGQRIVENAVKDRKQLQQQQQQQKQADQSLDAPSDDDEAAKLELDQTSGTLIQSLLDAIGHPHVVADAALTYLSAGRDTTGQALTWAFYLLIRHPRVLRRLREEVDEHQQQQQHGVSSSLDPDPTRFTPAAMPYAMAVFYEALRLYPPIPFEMRQCAAPAVLPDGTRLPRRAVVVWCLWAMGRSRTTWGPDADEFRPERWLRVVGDEEGGGEEEAEEEKKNNNNKPKRRTGAGAAFAPRPAAEFPVFNGGPRTCLGKKMAEAVAVQVIATVACLFDFAPAYGRNSGGEGEEAEERVSKSSLTLPMEGGLPVRVRVRRAEEEGRIQS